MSFRQFICLMMWGAMLVAAHARADMVVVMSENSSVEHLSREQVVNIFMGRYRKLPDDTVATPLDTGRDTPERQLFYRLLLNKTLAEINAYWARLLFSGKTAAPEDVESERKVLERVAHDPHALGYVDRQHLSGHVKVVYELGE
jgi:hypothetical protein